LTQTTLDAIGGGWHNIFYIPGNATGWFPSNNLLGFGGEFLFTTGDFSRWLVCDVTAVNGEYYANDPRPIKMSSISTVPYTAKWFYRNPAWEPFDPWVSLEDHTISIQNNTIMYGEVTNAASVMGSIHPTGMYVFNR
jgi:hypothetical protein